MYVHVYVVEMTFSMHVHEHVYVRVHCTSRVQTANISLPTLGHVDSCHASSS